MKVGDTELTVGDLVKIRHDSRTLGIVVALGDGSSDTSRHQVMNGNPITYRVWVSWNYLDSGVDSFWNWQLEHVNESR